MDPSLTRLAHTSTVPSFCLLSSQEPHPVVWLLGWETLARPYLSGPRFYHLREGGWMR